MAKPTTPFWKTTGGPVLPEGVKFLPSEDGWIYAKREAQEFVRQARAFDPHYSPIAQHDRDKAVELYRAAIESQPGAVVNAVLADRIAQLLAFNADPKNEVFPQPEKAAEWWLRCSNMTSPTQLLWAQSRMGLASAGVMKKSPSSSLPYLEEILRLDPESLELEVWKQSSFSQDPEWRKVELQRLQAELRMLQNTAREKIAYLEKAIKARELIANGALEPPKPVNRGGFLLLLNLPVLGVLFLIYVRRSRASRARE